MARNKFPGYCYCCGAWVEPGYGHFQRLYKENKWVIKCVKCASGRVVDENDPGVKWTQKAYEAYCNKLR